MSQADGTATNFSFRPRYSHKCLTFKRNLNQYFPLNQLRTEALIDLQFSSTNSYIFFSSAMDYRSVTIAHNFKSCTRANKSPTYDLQLDFARNYDVRFGNKTPADAGSRPPLSDEAAPERPRKNKRKLRQPTDNLRHKNRGGWQIDRWSCLRDIFFSMEVFFCVSWNKREYLMFK